MLLLSISVRPYDTEVIGFDSPVREGTVVTLMCRSKGARPAARITWFNGTVPFDEKSAEKVALQVQLTTQKIQTYHNS